MLQLVVEAKQSLVEGLFLAIGALQLFILLIERPHLCRDGAGHLLQQLAHLVELHKAQRCLPLLVVALAVIAHQRGQRAHRSGEPAGKPDAADGHQQQHDDDADGEQPLGFVQLADPVIAVAVEGDGGGDPPAPAGASQWPGVAPSGWVPGRPSLWRCRVNLRREGYLLVKSPDTRSP